MRVESFARVNCPFCGGKLAQAAVGSALRIRCSRCEPLVAWNVEHRSHPMD